MQKQFDQGGRLTWRPAPGNLWGKYSLVNFSQGEPIAATSLSNGFNVPKYFRT
jgi:hypothetical protein